MADVIEIWSEEAFNKAIKQEWVVLVDFYAEWCGPCKMLSPILHDLQDDNTDNNVHVVKVNTDDLPGIAWEYGIASIPAVFVFHNWSLVDQMIWLQEKSAYQDKIDSLLAA